MEYKSSVAQEAEPHSVKGSAAIEWLIHYRRLVLSLVLLLIAVGIMSLQSMARQEDPSFPYRYGLLKVFYPGATPSLIEQLVTEPIEEELAQVSEVYRVRSVSRDDVAIVDIELQDNIYDTDSAWDRVLRAVDRASEDFPAGVSNIEFDDQQSDMNIAVISITGVDDPIILDQAATRLKKELFSLPGVARIDIEGAPDKELIVKLDQQTINRLGISRQFIARTLAQRNQIIPGGLIASDEKNIRLNTHSGYQSIAELKQTNIALPSGQIVPLNAIADVSLEPKLPLSAQVFKDGRRAVSVGIIAERGQVDAIKFGRALRARLAAVKDDFAPLQLEESFFQPDYVYDRLKGLQGNLMLSIGIIALVVFLAMGWRTGILVSLVLPIVSLISIGIYSIGGGVFHQMAVIGVVIALGILIDNSIVVVEYIEAALRRGECAANAIRKAIRVLAKPLLASTGTTVAAFIPLLLADGGVGDFTRAVPTMIVIAMIVSYLLSVFTLPLVAFYWLKPSRTSQPQGNNDDNSELKPSGSPVLRFTQQLAKFCADLVEHQPKQVLLATLLIVGISLALSPTLKQEFFPSTDRAQIVIDVELPTNTPLGFTEKLSADIEAQVLAQPSVAAVYRSVGGTGFRFYYNLGGSSNESRVARLTVNTTSEKYNLPLVKWVRSEIKPQFPDAVIVPRLLGQGPDRPAPIEIRIKHQNSGTLFNATLQIKQLLSSIDGVTELRSNLDLGTPELVINIQENAALNQGLQPNEVASAVFAESRGLSAGHFLYADDPIPIRVRSSKGQATSIDVVRNQYIYGQSQQVTPINQLAALTPGWAPTSIRHHNSARTVRILAQVQKGYAFNQILDEFRQRISEAELDDRVVIEYGGDAEASSRANSNIAAAAPLAIGLLIFFMMFQFNSFRRISIVFATIPLAAVGVVPGLAISGQPFGFQSMLGVIALVGIVVNNAIVLIDVIDQRLETGAEIKEAVREALMQRTAPIILTTATTILGLLPLAFSSSTLWPPMAWAIVSGLLLSTVLTLVAIPALCVLFLGKKLDVVPAIQVTQSPAMLLLMVLFAFMLIAPERAVQAQEALIESSQKPSPKVLSLSLNEVIERVSGNRQLAAAHNDIEIARQQKIRVKRKAWVPTLSLGGELSRREEDSIIAFPTGQLSVSDASSYVYEVKLTQPLFQPAVQRHETAHADYQMQASEAQSAAVEQQVTGQAITHFLGILSLQESRYSDQALQASLEARRDRIQQELARGRALKTDLLQIDVELNRIRQRLVVIGHDIQVLSSTLAASLNLPVDTAIQPQSIGNLYTSLPTLERGDRTSLGCLKRADCVAMQRSLKALQQQRKQVSAGALPTVNLSVSDRRSDGLLFVAESDQRALLEFSWALFSGGQRRSQKRALLASEAAMEERLTSLQQQIQVDITRADARYQTGLSSMQLAQSSLALSDERLRLSRKRYDNGLLNLDQLLNAEASLVSSRADLSKAKIDLVQAWVQLALATGEGFAVLVSLNEAG